MPLAPKGSKSAGNKKANASPKTWNPAKNPIDKAARKAMSKGAVAKGKVIKLDGAVTSLATAKTVNKADATAAKRARSR
jgi:hypothetical protein